MPGPRLVLGEPAACRLSYSLVVSVAIGPNRQLGGRARRLPLNRRLALNPHPIDLRIHEAIELGGLGRINRDRYFVCALRARNAPPVQRIDAEALTELVGLDEQPPSGVVGWPA